MKFYVEYSVARGRGWGIVEFAFRADITRDAIKEQLVASYISEFHVIQMVKL